MDTSGFKLSFFVGDTVKMITKIGINYKNWLTG